MYKSFIRANKLGATIVDYGDSAPSSFYAGFLQCCQLDEYVKENPSFFIVEKWQSEDKFNWNKIEETEYSGVEWIGDVDHNSPNEMSACMGKIQFTYKNKESKIFENISVKAKSFPLSELINATELNAKEIRIQYLKDCGCRDIDIEESLMKDPPVDAQQELNKIENNKKEIERLDKMIQEVLNGN